MTENEVLLVLSNVLEPIRNDLQDIKSRVKKIELCQENNIIPRLQNIESCYTSTYDRYKNIIIT